MKKIFETIAKKIIDENKLLLVDIIVRGTNKNPSFEVFIDNTDGITTEICAKISREIKKEIESTEFSETDYGLTVSSPGITKPLVYLEQYKKHIGRELKISFDNGAKIQSIEAKLLSIDNNELTFEFKKEKLKIKFNQIKKAKVKLSF